MVIGHGGSSQPSSSGEVQLSGSITDESTGKAIPGAYFFVLNPGVSFDHWSNAGYPQEDVFSYTKSNSRGQYVLPVKISRNVGYTIVVSAEGYLDSYGDDLVWTDQDPSDYVMDLTLGK